MDHTISAYQHTKHPATADDSMGQYKTQELYSLANLECDRLNRQQNNNRKTKAHLDRSLSQYGM